jgi:hypothetical protein
VAHSETELQIQQPRSSLGTWLGIVLMFGIVAAFVWTVIGALPRGNKYEEQRAQVRMEKLQTAHKEWAALETYGWVDKEKGIVRMPVQRAMELSLAELAQRKPAPAGPIAPANPPAAPATAPVAPPAGAPPQTVPDASPKPAAISGPDSQVGGQPAAAANPANAPAGTQPGPHNPPPSPAPATSPAATAKPGGGQ